jgi:hypothetical protein
MSDDHHGRRTEEATLLARTMDDVFGTHRLMHRVRDVARDALGLEQLRLEVRGGEGLEDFYRRLGWQEIGRWPGALRFDHCDRDKVLMLLAPLCVAHPPCRANYPRKGGG